MYKIVIVSCACADLSDFEHRVVNIFLLNNWSEYQNLVNPLSTNPTKWSNTLKQFVGKLPTNCLSVFGHFVKLELKGLKNSKPFGRYKQYENCISTKRKISAKWNGHTLVLQATRLIVETPNALVFFQCRKCFRKGSFLEIKKACNLTEIETPAQVSSCKFCKSFKNFHFVEDLRKAASVIRWGTHLIQKS